MRDYRQLNGGNCSLPNQLQKMKADLPLIPQEEMFAKNWPYEGSTGFTPTNGYTPSLNPDLNGQPQSLKRNRMAVGEENEMKRSKRRFSPPATPSSGPFQTLRVTRSNTRNNHIALFKAEEDATSSYDTNHGQPNASQYPSGRTTMEQLTPYPTRRMQKPGNRKTAIDSGTELDVMNSQTLVGDVLNPGHGIYLEDEYPLGGDLMEEDIVCLLDSAQENAQETHLPPSSVYQDWDHESRSAAEYDQTLQYSSPFPSSGKSRNSQPVSVIEKPGSNDNLLDDDVDWDAVYAMTSTISSVLSTSGPWDTDLPPREDQTAGVEKVVECNPQTGDPMHLKPFVRPPFPEKVHDRSAISGLSSGVVLRTCFRIGEMINQAARCLNHQQEVLVELFARVTYSNREKLDRKQHFQFVDLFKDQQPYPAGILTNWRTGSELDIQSSIFLATGAGPKTCRCICRPRRDAKGLSLVVLSIREIDWVQIRWAKKIVCGESDGTF